MLDILLKALAASWQVAGEMSPYLLFGFLVAGALSVWISPQLVERHLGGRGLGPVIKAALFGVPLPLCSCGVIPVTASIRRHGASRGAASAFLLSTPQTGVDSIAITYALLGPVIAIFRPLIALLTGLIGGALVQAFDRPNGDEAPAAAPPSCSDACCEDQSGGAISRALRYGFITLPRDIGLPLLIGIVIAGLLTALVPQDRLANLLGPGILSILLMMLVGTPIYVCATASVPIALGFIHLGASPGAALAFLIAGPATNAAAFAVVWKTLGRRTALIYLAVVAASAVGGGLLLDYLIDALNAPPPRLADAAAHQHDGAGWLLHFWAMALTAVVAASYLLTGKHQSGTLSEDEDRIQTGVRSERVELLIQGMTCSHCANSVQRALAACPGVTAVEVDLQRGRAVVRGDALDAENLLAAANELGYSASLSDA